MADEATGSLGVVLVGPIEHFPAPTPVIVASPAAPPLEPATGVER